MLARFSYISEVELPDERFDEFRKKLTDLIGSKYKIKIAKTDKLIVTSKGKKRAVVIEK